MPLNTDYIGCIPGEQYRPGDGVKAAAHYAGLTEQGFDNKPQEYQHREGKLLALSVRVFPKDTRNASRMSQEQLEIQQRNTQANLAAMKIEIQEILNKSGLREYSGSEFVQQPGVVMWGTVTPSNIYSITFGNIPSADYDKLTVAIAELEKRRSQEHAAKAELGAEDKIEVPKKIPQKNPQKSDNKAKPTKDPSASM